MPTPRAESRQRPRAAARPARANPFATRLSLEPLEARHLLSAAPQLLADLGALESEPINWSLPKSVVVGATFFFAADGVHGEELWKSDGTPTGTMLVKDIRPGGEGSRPGHLTNVNGTLFFTANDGTHGFELWKSDGSEAGTVLVEDISSADSFRPAPNNQNLVNFNGTLFFAAGGGLWRSDGGEAGTVLVKMLTVSGGSFAVVGESLFFSGNDGTSGLELWKSDGSETGTVLVKDIRPGSPFSSSEPRHLVNVSGTLLFSANDGATGFELWKSDGSQAGTVLVKDIRPGTALFSSDPQQLVNVNGTLFFTAIDGTNSTQLWKSDGTEVGTVRVKNTLLGGFGLGGGSLTNVSGTLFFTASTTTGVFTGNELWKTDGTDVGTVVVRDIRSGTNSASPTLLTNVDGTLFFTANDGTNGAELWKSDGTEDGTTLVKDIVPGPLGPVLESLTTMGGVLYFFERGGVAGRPLWKSDGGENDTVIVRNITPTPSLPVEAREFVAVGGTTFFLGETAATGLELWKTDGTTAGTVLVKDIDPITSSSSEPESLTSAGGRLFFTAIQPGRGVALYTSDGTDAGTIPLQHLFLTNHRSPYFLTEVNQSLLFATVQDSGLWVGRLWKTDGTVSGTVPIKDGFSGGFDDAANVNGTLFFTAADDTNGPELWKSDGTTAGTVLVRDIVPGGDGSYPKYLTNINGTLFFTANNRELWKTDGSEAGTVLVKLITPDVNAQPIRGLTNVNGTLYFTADDVIAGSELWKSDGTPEGTAIVKDIAPGMLRSDPTGLLNLSGTLFFAANDGATGQELWKSDGTPEGTLPVTDVRPGPGGSDPSQLTEVGGMLYFAADDGTSGRELWRSDGTAELTVLVEIWPGASPADPNYLAEADGWLFFSANDGTSGLDPWVVPGPTKVTGRHIFYNQSAFDNNDAAINSQDSDAIAPDKTAYLPGDGLALFSSVTSYTRGINGIMIDLAGDDAHASITADDFTFKVGNNNAPETWTPAQAPAAVSVTTNFGGGGFDRITITWTDGVIQNQWLEVQILANADTDLDEPEVFYWGNRVGDSGTGTPATVFETSVIDAGQVFGNTIGSAAIDNRRDYDRSGAVTTADAGIVFANLGTLGRVDIGIGGALAPEGAPASAADHAILAFALSMGAPPVLNAAVSAPPWPGDQPTGVAAANRRVDAVFEQQSAHAVVPDDITIAGDPIDDALRVDDELRGDLIAEGEAAERF